MTDLSELLQEALWSLLEEKDVENVATCLRLASAQLGEPSKKRKRTSKRKKTKKKKKETRPQVSLRIQGSLPDNLRSDAFRAALIPMMEDLISGEVVYKGFTRMNNGTYCYNFDGMCPIHRRIHTDVGPWQLKQHPKSEWCGFKCWKQDSYSKTFSNPILSSF